MIGIFGGTFDPIHYGHLRTALDVQQALELTQLRLIPLKTPPHRPAPVATEQQRLSMLEAAIAGNPEMVADERELAREGKSYTYDTLLSLKHEFNQETLCLLIGSDAFQHFPQWYCPEEILTLAHLVIMQRPGEPIAEHYAERQTADADKLGQQDSGLIYIQPVTQLDISATQIRTMIGQKRSPLYLLPDAVLAVIEREKIYV